MLNRWRKLSAQQQSSLTYDHQRLTTLINNLNDGVVALDASLNVVLANGAALNVLNVNQIKNVPITNLLHLVDVQGNRVDAAALITNAHSGYSNSDYKLLYADGSSVHLYISVSPVMSSYSSGESWGFVMVIRDITTEKLLDEERDEFIGIVGHELLEPISTAQQSMSKALAMVKEIGASEIAVQSVKNAYDQLMFLNILTNDLAVLSRADRGKLAVNIQKFSVPELIQELSNAFTARAIEKNLKLTFEVDPTVTELASSRLYVSECLHNLISNSLNYTVNGTISVSAGNGEGGVEFKVVDTGIGISQADQNRLFTKFFRSNDSRVRLAPGTGLGLYIIGKLVKLVGGRISVQSELDKGSTFSVFIPNQTVSS